MISITDTLENEKVRQTWKDFAAEVRGTFTEGNMGYDSVSVQHKNWTIFIGKTIIQAGDVAKPVTYVMVYINERNNFKFEIAKKDFISGIVQFFNNLGGNKSIKLNDPAFDKKYYLRGNDITKIEQIFRDRSVSQLITKIPGSFEMSIRGVDKLTAMMASKTNTELKKYIYFTQSGIIEDKEYMKQLFAFIMALLNKMEEVGVIDSNS